MMKDKDSIKLEIQQLVAALKSLQLATISRDGKPKASYSPFIYQATNRDQTPDFFIFVSGLASHTDNLLANTCCSVMLIEDEAQTANIHQRKRLMLNCRAAPMKREEKESLQILDDMTSHLGNTMNMIQQLPDFILFRLQVSGGRYVKGFGAAYLTDAALEPIELIKGR